MTYYTGIMNTYLEIRDGPEAGVFYRLRPNFRIGSGDCELRVSDPQVPALHSQVLLDNRNQMVLVCTNAVFEISANGKSVKKAVLSNGTLIKIGSVTFKVVETDKEVWGSIDPLLPKEGVRYSQNWFEDDRPRETPVAKFKEPESPKSKLLGELRKTTAEFKNPPFATPFKLFRTPFRLLIESGPQADDEFIVSWGPREFGPMSLEFPIEFPPFPGTLFTLSPSDEGEVVFSTKHPDFARVSGHTDVMCVINDQDRIQAGNSTIVIHLLKDNVDND